LDKCRNLAVGEKFDDNVIEPLSQLVLLRMCMWQDEVSLFDRMVEVQKKRAKFKGDVFNVKSKDGVINKDVGMMRDDLSMLFCTENINECLRRLERGGLIRKVNNGGWDLGFKVNKEKVEELFNS